MKRLYNWFCLFYSGIEKDLSPKVEKIVASNVATIPGVRNATALEYACGTGMLTFKLAKIFSSVDARDASTGMLGRAIKMAAEEKISINFKEGNILEPAEKPDSYDYAFVSFALHLFSPKQEARILKTLLSIARNAVIIIDHGKKWSLSAAIVEWLEGGYYDTFIKTDFSRVAEDIGARKFEEKQIGFDSSNFSYLVFYK